MAIADNSLARGRDVRDSYREARVGRAIPTRAGKKDIELSSG
jgi:hypothetical protein